MTRFNEGGQHLLGISHSIFLHLALFNDDTLLELKSLSLGVNFINVLRTAFTPVGPKSAKRHC